MEYLGLLGVTHVLNTAEGFGARMTVNTSQEYYSPAGVMSTLCIVEQMCDVCTAGIVYMGLRLVDVTQTNISRHFPKVMMMLTR